MSSCFITMKHMDLVADPDSQHLGASHPAQYHSSLQSAVPLHAYMLHVMCCSTARFLAACDVLNHRSVNNACNLATLIPFQMPTCLQTQTAQLCVLRLSNASRGLKKAQPILLATCCHQLLLKADRQAPQKRPSQFFQSGADPCGGVCATHPSCHNCIYSKCNGHRLWAGTPLACSIVSNIKPPVSSHKNEQNEQNKRGK